MNQDKSTGQFVKGNTAGKGRPKGSRNKLTNRMLERFAERNEDGISVEEILFDIAQDGDQSSEMRFKAAAKLADLVFPKAQSVELEITENDGKSLAELDDRIRQLLNEEEETDEED